MFVDNLVMQYQSGSESPIQPNKMAAIYGVEWKGRGAYGSS